MKKIISKPHIFFFALVFIFLFVALIKGNNIVNINIGYTYYTIEVKTFCLISSIFFGLVGFNYFAIIWAKKKPKKWLTITHLLLQILALIPFIYLLLTVNDSSGVKSLNDLEFIKAINFIGFLIFLLASFIHLINFFVSLFLKRE